MATTGSVLGHLGDDAIRRDRLNEAKRAFNRISEYADDENTPKPEMRAIAGSLIVIAEQGEEQLALERRRNELHEASLEAAARSAREASEHSAEMIAIAKGEPREMLEPRPEHEMAFRAGEPLSQEVAFMQGATEEAKRQGFPTIRQTIREMLENVIAKEDAIAGALREIAIAIDTQGTAIDGLLDREANRDAPRLMFTMTQLNEAKAKAFREGQRDANLNASEAIGDLNGALSLAYGALEGVRRTEVAPVLAEVRRKLERGKAIERALDDAILKANEELRP